MRMSKMNRECLRCRSYMEEVEQATLPLFCIQKKEAGLKALFAKISGVTVFVCPECGYVEQVACKPEIFNN